MLLMDTAVTMFKTIGVIVLGYILYKIYELVFFPWRIRQKYKKYSNVSMSERFYPMVGDIMKVVQNEKENKHRFRHYNDLALENKNYDFNISQQGPLTAIDIVSPEALTEFEKLIPERIDRHPNGDGIPFANIAPECEGLLECTKDNMERRKEIMKTMGVNKISQYIPLMIETADKWAKAVKINQNTDLTFELSKLNFTVMAKILFGTDVDDMPPVEYISYQTGERKSLPIAEFYIRYLKDEFDGFLNPKGKFFPFMIKYGLVEPYKTNLKNHRAFSNAIRNFVLKTKDTESVYKKLESLGKFSQDVLLIDTIMLLFAGFDTLAHFLSSCLYYLTKYPTELHKLRESLDKSGITNIEISMGDKLKDIYDNCDYLNYFIKEILRIDSPTGISLLYYAKEDVEMLGVPFSKGQPFNLNMMYTHYNPKEWKEPTKFIPERFDPESEYFFKPNTDKQARHPKSFNPFSFGIRNCLGQSLAKVEAKVVLTRILFNLDFEVEQDQLDNDNISFNFFSQFTLKGKFKPLSKN